MTGKAEAAIQMTKAIADAIRDLTAASDLGGVPNGMLWARLDGKITFGTYTAIIDVLKRAKLVEERNNLLVWIGPRVDIPAAKR